MKNKLKELIEAAPSIKSGIFDCFLIVPNGKYNGFWGKNGYNNIILLVKKPKDTVWYKICDKCDKFTIFDIIKNATFNLDIPSDYNVVRIWFHKPVRIKYDVETADIFGYMEDYKESED